MKKQRGSYTLEAVIVMSTLIMIIFAIISAFLLLYQNAVMYYVATKAAQEGAIRWVDTGHNLDGGQTGVDDQGLYYRITELFSDFEAQEKEVELWIMEKMAEMMPQTLVGNGTETVDVKFGYQFVQRVVEVRITKEVNIPFRGIAQYFDQDLDMEVTVKASVAEPAEYIRNIDYGVELAQEVWAQIKDKLDGLIKSKK